MAVFVYRGVYVLLAYATGLRYTTVSVIRTTAVYLLWLIWVLGLVRIPLPVFASLLGVGVTNFFVVILQVFWREFFPLGGTWKISGPGKVPGPEVPYNI